MSNKAVEITVICPDGIHRILQPGDQIDFGKHGLLVFFPDPEAEAVRIFQRERQKIVRNATEFARRTPWVSLEERRG